MAPSNPKSQPKKKKSTKADHAGQKGKKEKPTKTPNPFLLFRKKFSSRMDDTKSLSKQAGEAWHNLSEQERLPYRKEYYTRKLAAEKKVPKEAEEQIKAQDAEQNKQWSQQSTRAPGFYSNRTPVALLQDNYPPLDFRRGSFLLSHWDDSVLSPNHISYPNQMISQLPEPLPRRSSSAPILPETFPLTHGAFSAFPNYGGSPACSNNNDLQPSEPLRRRSSSVPVPEPPHLAQGASSAFPNYGNTPAYPNDRDSQRPESLRRRSSSAPPPESYYSAQGASSASVYEHTLPYTPHIPHQRSYSGTRRGYIPMNIYTNQKRSQHKFQDNLPLQPLPSHHDGAPISLENYTMETGSTSPSDCSDYWHSKSHYLSPFSQVSPRADSSPTANLVRWNTAFLEAGSSSKSGGSGSGYTSPLGGRAVSPPMDSLQNPTPSLNSKLPEQNQYQGSNQVEDAAERILSIDLGTPHSRATFGPIGSKFNNSAGIHLELPTSQGEYFSRDPVPPVGFSPQYINGSGAFQSSGFQQNFFGEGATVYPTNRIWSTNTHFPVIILGPTSPMSFGNSEELSLFNTGAGSSRSQQQLDIGAAFGQ